MVGAPSHSISGRLSAGPAPDPTLALKRYFFPARRREAIPRAAEHSSGPAMLMPPHSPHGPGCTPGHAVYESVLDHTHPILDATFLDARWARKVENVSALPTPPPYLAAASRGSVYRRRPT